MKHDIDPMSQRVVHDEMCSFTCKACGSEFAVQGGRLFLTLAQIIESLGECDGHVLQEE